MHVEDASVRMWGPPGRLTSDVYTDGSAVNARDTQGRRAGWAVATLTSEGELRQARWGAVPCRRAMSSMLEMHRTPQMPL
eukprot:5685513-Amphidinium_carterae.4